MRARTLFVAPFSFALLVGAACGGSASETPWPVEPDSFKTGVIVPGEATAPASITQTDGGTAIPRAYPTAP